MNKNEESSKCGCDIFPINNSSPELLENCTKEQLIQHIQELTTKVNTLLDEKQILQYQLEVQKYIVVNNNEDSLPNEYSDLIRLSSVHETTEFEPGISVISHDEKSIEVVNTTQLTSDQDLSTDPFPIPVFDDEDPDNHCSSELNSTSGTVIEDHDLLATTSTALEDSLHFEDFVEADWITRVQDVEKADINELTKLHLEVLPYEIIPSVGEEQIVVTSSINDNVENETVTTDSTVETPVKRNSNDFKCHICQNTYKYHFSLKRHLNHQHNISSFVNNRKSTATDKSVSVPKMDSITPTDGDKEVNPPACLQSQHVNPQEKEKPNSRSSDDNTDDQNGGGKKKKRTTRKKKIVNLICELCGQSFKYLYNYQRHIKKLHFENEEKIPCTICTKVFPSHKSLRRHQSDVHFTSMEDKQFQCHLCLELFKYHYLLQRHIARVHEMKDRVTCSICSKTFATDYHLRRHLVLHQRNGIDVKDLCRNTTNGCGAVKKRPRSHGSQFICEFCGKIFPKKNRLVQHSVSHADEKPFSCNLCDKSFTRKAKLLQHQRSQHFSEDKSSSAAEETVVGL